MAHSQTCEMIVNPGLRFNELQYLEILSKTESVTIEFKLSSLEVVANIRINFICISMYSSRTHGAYKTKATSLLCYNLEHVRLL